MSFRRFLTRQLVAIVLALLVLVVADQAAVSLSNFRDSDQATVVSSSSNYFRSWRYPAAAPAFQRALDSRALLVFGSSELHTDLPFAPQRLFPEHFGRAVYAFGDSGAQSLTILVNLMQNHQSLKADQRVVVLLSPWWFSEGGTSPSAFRIYTQRNALSQIYFDSDIATEFKDAVRSYLAERQTDSGDPTESLLYMQGNHGNPILEEFVRLTHFTLPEFVRAHSHIYQNLIQPQIVFASDANLPVAPFDWEVELERAKQDHRMNSKNNVYGFSDEKWTNRSCAVPRKVRPPDPRKREFRDLTALVHFVKSQGIPTLFVMQPLNRLAYTDLENFGSLAQDVQKMMKDNDADYVDLMSRDYEKEMLVDLAHPSGYGWLRYDIEIQNWLTARPESLLEQADLTRRNEEQNSQKD